MSELNSVFSFLGEAFVGFAAAFLGALSAFAFGIVDRKKKEEADQKVALVRSFQVCASYLQDILRLSNGLAEHKDHPDPYLAISRTRLVGPRDTFRLDDLLILANYAGQKIVQQTLNAERSFRETLEYLHMRDSAFNDLIAKSELKIGESDESLINFTAAPLHLIEDLKAKTQVMITATMRTHQSLWNVAKSIEGVLIQQYPADDLGVKLEKFTPLKEDRYPIIKKYA